MAADESYPDALRYHPEHDWARIDGDEATLGITWYAQDALGEIVHFEPPEAGSSLARGESYGEVESVKAVSEVIAPLSGEVLESRRSTSFSATSPRAFAFGDRSPSSRRSPSRRSCPI